MRTMLVSLGLHTRFSIGYIYFFFIFLFNLLRVLSCPGETTKLHFLQVKDGVLKQAITPSLSKNVSGKPKSSVEIPSVLKFQINIEFYYQHHIRLLLI